jgi:DNA-3-methyladenine glycosylase II
MDGVLRLRGGVVHRLLHVEEEPVVVRVAQIGRDAVLFGASGADRERAREGVERMRFALAVDDDLSRFHERFRWDPLIGRALRADPGRRVLRRPEPFEALAWAVTEQLIEFARAVEIQRRMVRRLGRRCPSTGLLAPPAAATLAGIAPALLQSFDLAAGRAIALVRCAREVEAGRVDLADAAAEERLRRVPGIGTWTLDMLALHGRGRLERLPAGDVGYLKLVGRLQTGNPRARVEEEEVRRYFEPYQPWSALAADYVIGSLPRPMLAVPSRPRAAA